MEPKRKKILAVAIIAMVAVGVGIGVWILLPTPYGAVVLGELVTPGAPDDVPDSRIIRVGLLGPMTEIQGEGTWQGAYLACDKINTAGGVLIGGDRYYFGLIAEDTFEADPIVDLPKVNAAATKIVTDDKARFIIGGFRTEAVLSYQEIIMDNEMLFLGAGPSTDTFCQLVNSSYSRYKYWFRVTPINSTSLATELITYLVYLTNYMSFVLGRTVDQVAILREDHIWSVPLALGLKGALAFYGLNLSAEIAFPPTADAADFNTYWSQIEANGTQICVPMISAQGGLLMTTQYQALQPQCLIAGIDVQSQLDTYWSETGGACEYEVILQALTRTNKTTKSIAFWDDYVSHYDEEPIYTATGSYDAMYALLHAIDQGQTLNSTELVPVLETINATNPLEGVAGNLAFTYTHDVTEGYNPGTQEIWGVTLFTQWQAGGKKECLSSGNLVYPDYVVTANLALPSWGIN